VRLELVKEKDDLRFIYFVLTDDRSILSEESSFWGEDRERSGHFSVNDPALTWSQTSTDVSLNMDQLVVESTSKGSPRSEVQLRLVLNT